MAETEDQKKTVPCRGCGKQTNPMLLMDQLCPLCYNKESIGNHSVNIDEKNPSGEP